MHVVVFALLALLGAGVHIWWLGSPVARTLLLYVLFFCQGVGAVYAFLGHYFKSDMVAQSIGWPTGSPFQKEIAFANLGHGITGLLAPFMGVGFWLATILAHGVFMGGAATVHLMDIKATGNRAWNNAGPQLWADILVPVVSLLLWLIVVLGG